MEEVPALDNGTQPSIDAAVRHEVSGIKSKKQRLFAILIGQAKENGLTVGELREAKSYRYHHGSSSGLLSTMHSRGILVALTQRRGGQTVYVLPEFVNGRETRPYGRQKGKREESTTEPWKVDYRRLDGGGSTAYLDVLIDADGNPVKDTICRGIDKYDDDEVRAFWDDRTGHWREV